MALVFQYGSNTSESRLNSEDRLNGDARVDGIAYTRDKYELGFTVNSSINGCASADMILNGNTHIWGVLYDIPNERIYRELEGREISLDAIEGEGGNYKRMDIEVVSGDDGSILEAITYVVRNRSDNVKTAEHYVEHILTGLMENEIPRDYVDYACGRIIKNNPELKGFVNDFVENFE